MHNTAASHMVGMSRRDTKTHPLTHHEILGLIEPFVRRGRHVDLAASDRINRRLMFKSVEHASEDDRFAVINETMQLENPQPDSYRLTRNLMLPSGLKATMRI